MPLIPPLLSLCSTCWLGQKTAGLAICAWPKSFEKVRELHESLTSDEIKAAEEEYRETRTTTNSKVAYLLRELSAFGHGQHMSNEERLYARRKIQSLCLQNGMSNIWFTINPNDLTNEINMKLTAFRGQNEKEAEKLFRMLQQHIKSIQHTVRDPVSASVFFHREISLFFEKYVRTGENSVFGKVSCYFACVETNERGLFISMAFCGLKSTSTCQTCWRTRRSPRTRAIGS